jgi:hypothetical protein
LIILTLTWVFYKFLWACCQFGDILFLKKKRIHELLMLTYVLCNYNGQHMDEYSSQGNNISIEGLIDFLK